MSRDSSSPSPDDDHAERVISLQASLYTAKEVIPVFTSALDRNSLLYGGLDLLQRKLIGLSNPRELLALKTSVLSKLSGRLQELFCHLDDLVDREVQKKAQYFHGIIRQRIDSQPGDGQRAERHPEWASTDEEIQGKRKDQEKRQNACSNHQNLEALQMILSFRCLLESKGAVISSEYHKTLSDVKSGSVINRHQAVQYQAHILESCELLRLAIDRAWPESAAGIADLIIAKDPDTDQVDDILVRVEDANKVCSRLERIYELLSKKLHGCKFMGQFPKFHLSGLENDIIGFMFPRCVGTKGWHPMPCRIYHGRHTMPPFRDCKDFRHAEALNKCFTLNLGKDQKLLTETVPKSSELGREYGTIPDKFITLKQVLHAETTDQTAKATMELGMVRRLCTRFLATMFQTPKHERNDEELDYRSALTKNVVAVQYLLSESVLHLYGTPWLIDIWQPDHIEFPKDGALLNFKKPYYLFPLSLPEQVAPLDPYDHAETFMAKFGLLLLQLQLQQSFPLETEDQSDDIWPSIALGRYYDDSKESLQPINEVVDACLDFRRHLFEDLDARDKNDVFRFRMVFYKRILVPLRALLLVHCPEVAVEIQGSFVCNTSPQDEHQEGPSNRPREEPTPIRRNGACSRGAFGGETMLKRSRSTSTEWFNKLDKLNEYLTAHAYENEEDSEAWKTYETSRVKVAVIDSGLRQERQGEANITYHNFIKKWNDKHRDDPQHGTNSVDLIRKVYGRADLYIAKVFQGNEADENTSKYMAEAIKWAISKKVDIISISAGFREESHDELEAQIKMATAGGAEPEILVFAAASNWQNISGVAYPASMTDRVMCIFCCNGGLKPSREWNPNPGNHAANFAFLGEDVVLNSGANPLCGTSVSTALAAGLAAKLLDFSRQPDVQSWMSKASRDKMRTKAGMSAILKEMSRNHVSEGYECVNPR